MQPFVYELMMDVDMDRKIFNCDVKIYVDVFDERENTVVINCAKNINLREIKVNNVSETYLRLNDDEIKISSEKFFVGKNLVHIYYDSNIGTNMSGLYMSTYEDSFIVTTQMEPTHAREVFPCFDDPSMKAIFRVCVKTQKGYTVLSNTSPMKIETSFDNNYETIYFNETPPMSTYLLALVIGNFYKKKMLTNNNIPVTVYGLRDEISLEFACSVGVKCLEFCEKWFDLAYPLDKLDFVAIPDFSSGAMENWGLITFREKILLCDEYTSEKSKINIIITICHELAHQWFGNYVTLESWKYLWLNESMATFFGWFISDSLFPEYELTKLYIHDEYSKALEYDMLNNSHPIEVEVNDQYNINFIFDDISYAKGSVIIRMIFLLFGEEIFQKAINKYLRDNIFKNTKSSDLWEAFEYFVKKENIDIDFMTIIRNWLTNKGFPVVTIDVQNNVLTFEQNSINNSDTIWHIVTNVNISNLHNSIENKIIIKNKKAQHKLHDTNNEFYFNLNRMGFAQFLYNYEINLSKLSEDSISYIIDDYFILASKGKCSYSKPFNILKNIKFTNKQICKVVLNHLVQIFKISNDKQISILIENIFSKILNNKDYDSEFIVKKIVEMNVFNYLKKVNFKTKYCEMYCHTITQSIDEKCDEYLDLIKSYKSEKSVHKKDILLHGLAYTNVKNVGKVLDILFSDTIRDQDVIMFVQLLFNNSFICKLVLENVYKRWDYFAKKYEVDSSHITHLVKSMAHVEKNIYKYCKFFEEQNMKNNMAVIQGIEQLQMHKILVDNLNSFKK